MLKTNYKNFIPNENGRRYQITQDSQGYNVITDATTYLQQGDNVGANDINAQNILINNGIGEKILDLVATFTDLATTYPPSVDYANYKVLVADTNTIYKCVLNDNNNYEWLKVEQTPLLLVITYPDATTTVSKVKKETIVIPSSLEQTTTITDGQTLETYEVAS